MAWSGKASRVDAGVGGRRVPDGQRRHGAGEGVAQGVGGLAVALAEGGGLEAGEGLGVELEEEGLRAVDEAGGHGPVLVGGVPGLEVGGLLGDVAAPEAAVGDVAVELVRVGGAAALGGAVAAPAGERPDAGAALVADHVVGVVARRWGCRRARPCRGGAGGGRGRAGPTGRGGRRGRARPPASGWRPGRRRARRSGGRGGSRRRGARGRWCRGGRGRRRRSSRRRRRRRR